MRRTEMQCVCRTEMLNAGRKAALIAQCIAQAASVASSVVPASRECASAGSAGAGAGCVEFAGSPGSSISSMHSHHDAAETRLTTVTCQSWLDRARCQSLPRLLSRALRALMLLVWVIQAVRAVQRCAAQSTRDRTGYRCAHSLAQRVRAARDHRCV